MNFNLNQHLSPKYTTNLNQHAGLNNSLCLSGKNT
jgi:hypothetical protein